jgi:hypothetical protein
MVAEIITYKGIECSIRPSLGREAWILTFSPRKGQKINKRYLGTRNDALRAARGAIDRWLKRHRHARGPETLENSN